MSFSIFFIILWLQSSKPDCQFSDALANLNSDINLVYVVQEDSTMGIASSSSRQCCVDLKQYKEPNNLSDSVGWFI